MSYMLQHLHSGWAVDQAIVTEEERIVCIRFGHDYDPECIKMDELLYKIAEDVKNFCVIYLVDITEVPDFNGMYELYDPVSVMFFYRNKHMMVDLGTGNNNKINWAMNDKQELIDIIETVFRGARKGTCQLYNTRIPFTWIHLKFNPYSPPVPQSYFYIGRGLVISPKDYSTKYRY